MEPLHPFVEKRPWGEFEEFIKNSPVTVKLIFIKKGEELSLQKHHERSEFWKVVKGSPRLVIGEAVYEASEGDEFTVPVETNHRVGAPSDDVELLEIAQGKFDESDIVRLEDKYGR
ncbi:phosphomannose isomerase type II C-terminal cupin domain [Candidatus Parcubacteria bacterium]|nr:phosphomannose isomerase type II C-terminal cupin domain [Candidatus Parcubacteria bacterium]